MIKYLLMSAISNNPEVGGDWVDLAFLSAAAVSVIIIATAINTFGFHLVYLIPLGLLLASWGTYHLPCIQSRIHAKKEKTEQDEKIEQIRSQIKSLEKQREDWIEANRGKNFDPTECDAIRKRIGALRAQMRVILHLKHIEQPS